MIFCDRQPGKARADAWLGIAAGVIAAGAALAGGKPWAWAAGGAGSIAGGAIALRRTSEFAAGRRLELGQSAIQDSSALAALAHLLRPAPLAQQIESAQAVTPALPQSQWWGEILECSAVLITGRQGSGKTSTAARLIRDRLALGHKVTVLDPHAFAGQYPAGVVVVGAGKKYGAIEVAIAEFIQDIERFYEAAAVTPGHSPSSPRSLICEEMTQWSRQVSNAAQLVATALSDCRKAGRHVAFISHGKTLATTGGAAGFKESMIQGMATVELYATEAAGGKPAPTLTGDLYRPGNKAPVPILIDPIGTPAPAIAPSASPALESLERAWELPAIEIDHQTIAEGPQDPNAEQSELIEIVCAIARRHGRPITASDCTRGSRKLKALGPDGVRELFLVARSAGLGSYSDGKFSPY